MKDFHEDIFKASSALFAECRLVSEFISGSVRAWLPEERNTSGADAVVFGQFLRVDAWLRTLKKCDEPGDFQAAASATRSLLETLIDLVLVANNPLNMEVLKNWEDSAKLKHADALLTYYGKIKSDSSAEHAEMILYSSRNKARILELRRKHRWLNKKGQPIHPDRWTNKKLVEDARLADRASPAFGFEHFYETRYRELCWYVHGSGLTGVRELTSDIFPFLSGRMFRVCADMGEHAAKVTLQHFNKWENVQRQAFDDLADRRVIQTAHIMEMLTSEPEEQEFNA